MKALVNIAILVVWITPIFLQAFTGPRVNRALKDPARIDYGATAACQ